jgi:hypothetical protein
MSRLQFLGSIAWAAFVVALLSPRPADAQIGVDPGPPREPGGLCNNLLTGVQYDIWNQALAECHLPHLQAKLRHDSERGKTAAVERDVRRIDNHMYRIAMDEWLIRWNSRQDPGFYPIRTDPVSCAAIAEAGRPAEFSYRQTGGATQDPYPPGGRPTLDPNYSPTVPTPGPMAAVPTIPITIVNAGPAGANVSFAIDGVSHETAGGTRQDLTVDPNSIITYDGGGSLGKRRYQISPGVYEFRSTSEGWALYKRPATP